MNPNVIGGRLVVEHEFVDCVIVLAKYHQVGGILGYTPNIESHISRT